MSIFELAGIDIQRKALQPKGGCHSCPRKRAGFTQPILNKGPVLWLMESPTANDAAAGALASGATGSVISEAARAAHIPEPWSFTTVTHCPPTGEQATPKEISCCLSQYVLEELQGYPVVVMLGNAVLQALFPGAKATHFRGNVAWHPDFPMQRFFMMPSPGAVLRDPSRKEEFMALAQRLGRVVAERNTPPAWTLHQGKQAVDFWRQSLANAPVLSLDLETTGLESWKPGESIRSLAATADGVNVVVAAADEPVFGTLLGLVKDYMLQAGKSVLGSNVGFDLEWLERELGIRTQCQLIHETGVQWYHAGQYKMPSLKELVSRELDGYRYLVWQPHLERDTQLLLRYNAEDVIYSLQLMRKAMGILKPKTRDLVLRVLGPTNLILRRMSTTGLYMRNEYRQQKITEYANRRAEIVAAWHAADPDFIPGEHESGNGLNDYLFRIKALPVLQQTSGGTDPSTDKSVLKQWVRDGYSFVQHLLNLREIDKIVSTYLTGYDKHVSADSRIRSSYPLTWTDSGRTSSREPNLQNIPRKKEIRDLFGVKPGSVLIEADLSQIEFRIMVCLANDANGIAGYMRGEDAHTMTARAISGNPHPTKEQRTNAKPINFGFLYGAQAQTVQGMVADDYGAIWTDQQAHAFRETFMRTYPAIPGFHATSKQRLINNRGWFESVVGHVFHYEKWDAKDNNARDHTFRSALNAEAQGPAAQLMFYIMILSRRLLDARGFTQVEFVNTVHDSVLVDVPNPAWAPDVIATMREATQQAKQWVQSWFVVPLVLDFKLGESWGSLEDVK